MTVTSYPQPNPGESYKDFVIRAHHELIQALPEPMDRNRAVWNAWENANGDPERYRARSYFPEDLYDREDHVCYWHEHTAVSYDAQGNPSERANDVHRIAEIIEENNERIADTDSYSAVVDKHTPQPKPDPATGKLTKPDDEKNPAKTIGFTGPFRIGMIGRLKPRFAAFADEFRQRDKKKIFSDRPRRSVEVLTLKANGRSYFDPIAALSESPRLPLPVSARYSADDNEVERSYYEAVPAYPGGNTYIPGGGESRKQNRYDACSGDYDHDSTSNQAGKMFGNQNGQAGQSGNPDQTRTIVDAIMATPLMQFLQQLAEQNGFNQGGQPAQAQPAAKENYMPSVPPVGGFGAMAGRYAANENPAQVESEPLIEYEIDDSETVSKEQFSALATQVQEVMAENAQLKQNQVKLAATNADAQRSAELTKLHAEYPHFIDIESESKACLYSAGSTMTDEGFDAHLDRLEMYAKKSPPVSGRMVPGGESGISEPEASGMEKVQYAADISARATEIYTARMEAGEILTPEESYTLAEKEIAGSQATEGAAVAS